MESLEELNKQILFEDFANREVYENIGRAVDYEEKVTDKNKKFKPENDSAGLAEVSIHNEREKVKLNTVEEKSWGVANKIQKSDCRKGQQ